VSEEPRTTSVVLSLPENLLPTNPVHPIKLGRPPILTISKKI
jgi:hypothetical protein